ncbi:MAG: permease [Alphaproteobacteria bacterium]|nr:permease [Alphaproteobacteria bacterium]MBO6863433.1 permease [Alphaproteobacteria bacterium]
MRQGIGWLGPVRPGRVILLSAGFAGAVATAVYPGAALETFTFVLHSLLSVAPIVVPGILVAAWVTSSGAGGRVAAVFNGHALKTVLVASAIGAVTPVCGVTVLPLMVGLLSAGVPLAPVMAFWLSSPVTDPAMLATTAATLGMDFAVGKTVAAFGIGMLGGSVTALIVGRDWVQNPLRENGIVRGLQEQRPCGCGPSRFVAAPWADPERRAVFLRQALATTRLILICLTPAFAAEHVLQAVLDPHALAPLVGKDVWWAVPLAVFVGAPAYLDGYAALPLTRGLIDHGMAPGAAMAFLVSGGVVSIWGAMAILPVLRTKAFALYLTIALTGSLIAGWVFGLVV